MARDGPSAWRFPLLVLAIGFIGAAALGMQPRPGRPVAAVFPPWWGLTRAFGAAAAAGGNVLRSGAWPALIVTQSPDPGFATRLHAAGAWLVLDPFGFGTCGSTQEEPRP